MRAKEGADPAAVAFDGVTAGVARGTDTVVVDTAGRLHTRDNLMEELAKIRRVIGRALPGAPHTTLLALDATLGQNTLAQARQFQAEIGVDAVLLNKLDGTARGGAVVALVADLELPIALVGVGEGLARRERVRRAGVRARVGRAREPGPATVGEGRLESGRPGGQRRRLVRVDALLLPQRQEQALAARCQTPRSRPCASPRTP